MSNSGGGESKYDVTMKALDMSDEMKDEAIRIATEAFKTSDQGKIQERELAKIIKTAFDKRYGGTWHCVVGRSFGSFVTHESRSFVYFSILGVAVLLFKHG
eukprot:TRINITY_DN3083_c0_g1_i2.p1 TRINITY_DN3083_c0_g1~~TRINITY_DN3083_c0_g1_i2.p1  ORF type:complete len:101 (+),score=24.72 TRINITY_DN3083_c0_g1_i2:26-328(+)